MTRENSLQPPASSLRLRGQSLLEYSVLVAAVAVALIAISQYVGRAITVNSIDIETELSGRPCQRDAAGRPIC